MLLLPAQLTLSQTQSTLRVFKETTFNQIKPQELERNCLVVDASVLTTFDSSALAVLLECRRMALSKGWTFATRHLPTKLLNLAKLYKIESLLQHESASGSVATDASATASLPA